MNDGLFRLRWTNHTSTFTRLLEQFRLQGLFCDATVACDRKIFPVHQAVLSACSDFFFTLFASTRHQNPVIVLQDVGPSHIENLLLYMYSGEAKVPRQDLPDFMKVAESLQIKGLAVPSSPLVEGNLGKQNVSNVSLENVPSYQRFSNTVHLFHPQPQSLNKSGCDNPEQHSLTSWQNLEQVDHDRGKGSGFELMSNSRIGPHELENEGFVPDRTDPDRRQSLSEEQQGDKSYFSEENLHHANLKEENVPLFTSHCIYSPDESNCEMGNSIKEEAPDIVESYSTDFVTGMEDAGFRDDEVDAKELFIAEEDSESWNSQHQDDSLQEFDSMTDEHVNVGVDPSSQDGCESQLRRELLRPVHCKTSPIRLPWHKVHPNVPQTAPLKPQQQPHSVISQQPSTLRPPQHHLLRPQLQIPSLRPPQQPSSLGLPQQPSSLGPLQQSSSLRPPHQHSSLRPLQQPCSLRPQQPSSLNHPQQPYLLRPPQQPSSLRPQQLPSFRPPQKLPPLRPPQHPPLLRPPQHPLRDPPPLMKISSKSPVQGDFLERDSQTMAMQESRDRGLHSTHLLVEAPPTYQSCIVPRQLTEFQVSNPNTRSSGQNIQPVPMSSRSSGVLEHRTASEAPLNLSGQRAPQEGSEEVIREHVFEKVSSRRRRHRGPKSWEFLVRLIKDPATNPALIRWEDEASGTFRLVRPSVIAQRWGRRSSKHANESLTYENFARGLRYHYATGALHPVSERNLVYRFGITALALLRKYSSVSEPVPAPLTSIESGS